MIKQQEATTKQHIQLFKIKLAWIGWGEQRSRWRVEGKFHPFSQNWLTAGFERPGAHAHAQYTWEKGWRWWLWSWRVWLWVVSQGRVGQWGKVVSPELPRWDKATLAKSSLSLKGCLVKVRRSTVGRLGSRSPSQRRAAFPPGWAAVAACEPLLCSKHAQSQKASRLFCSKYAPSMRN